MLLPLFIAISAELNLPTGLLYTLCRVESNLNPKAYKPKDGNSPSYGLCQVKYETAKLVGFKGKPKDLMDPRTNINVAGRILASQYKRYGNWAKAVCAYNKGSSTSHGGSRYLAKVFDAYFSVRPEGFQTTELRKASPKLRRKDQREGDAEGEEFSLYSSALSPGIFPFSRPYFSWGVNRPGQEYH